MLCFTAQGNVRVAPINSACNGVDSVVMITTELLAETIREHALSPKSGLTHLEGFKPDKTSVKLAMPKNKPIQLKAFISRLGEFTCVEMVDGPLVTLFLISVYTPDPVP